MCTTLSFAAAEARPGRIATEDLAIAEARRWRSLTQEQRHQECLTFNARRAVPLPVCRVCDLPYNPEDAHPLVDHTCQSCGGEILENLAFDYIFAKGRHSRKKAAIALRRLAHTS